MAKNKIIKDIPNINKLKLCKNCYQIMKVSTEVMSRQNELIMNLRFEIARLKLILNSVEENTKIKLK